MKSSFFEIRSGQHIVFLDLMLATHFATRLRGLLGRAPLKPNCGLLIRPCNAIHTFMMRQPIDVVFLDADGHVLRTCQAVPPRRVRMCWQAKSVIELRAGEIARLGLRRPNSRLFAT